MSKELEACNNPNATLDMLLKAQKDGASLEIHQKGSIGLIGTNGLNKIIQALTPPTEKEIVKGYNEYFKSLGGSPTVYYHNNGFYDNEGFLVELKNDIVTWCDDEEHNLPLDLAHKITTYFKSIEE